MMRIVPSAVGNQAGNPLPDLDQPHADNGGIDNDGDTDEILDDPEQDDDWDTHTRQRAGACLPGLSIS